MGGFPYQTPSGGFGPFPATPSSAVQAFFPPYAGSLPHSYPLGGSRPSDYTASQRVPVGTPYPSLQSLEQMEGDRGLRSSPDTYLWEDDNYPWTGPDSHLEGHEGKAQTHDSKGKSRAYSQRRPSNRDEFDGPHQLLDKPSPRTMAAQERELPHLATNLLVHEQDSILTQVNDRLSQCAFNFVAKYQFPIPFESDKRPVNNPNDREWTEWVFLLKRLATKRRIPARVLYNGQIKQLITVLENSLEMRHAAKHQSRPLKDDRNVLQLISAGLQVAKILKDALAMEYLDQIYVHTEQLIQMRKNTPGYLA